MEINENIINLAKKNNTKTDYLACIDFLNDKTTIEEISSEMDKLISEMGK